MGTRRFDTTMSFGRGALAKVQCSRCNHGQILNQAELLKLFPQPMPIKDAEWRLKCRVCGSEDGKIRAVVEVGR
jgi:aerobic-type carbon monoxide dehydrogenase small subunit (CoxS/CutS family)